MGNRADHGAGVQVRHYESPGFDAETPGCGDTTRLGGPFEEKTPAASLHGVWQHLDWGGPV
jgi:hypothetical protein